MATDKQIAANRQNARRCTGPTSERGKAVSSMNALKTGIDHKSEFIRVESREEYEALTAEYYEDFRPANVAERDLVDQLIRNEWLNRRFAAVDGSIWSRGLADGDLGKAFMNYSTSLLKLDRIRNSIQRNYGNALAQLIALRKARGAGLPAAVEADMEADMEAGKDQPAAPGIPELVSFGDFSRVPATEAAEQPEKQPTDPDDPPIAA